VFIIQPKTVKHVTVRISTVKYKCKLKQHNYVFYLHKYLQFLIFFIWRNIFAVRKTGIKSNPSILTTNFTSCRESRSIKTVTSNTVCNVIYIALVLVWQWKMSRLVCIQWSTLKCSYYCILQLSATNFVILIFCVQNVAVLSMGFLCLHHIPSSFNHLTEILVPILYSVTASATTHQHCLTNFETVSPIHNLKPAHLTSQAK
jgi:hypothetical protein